MTLLPGAEQLLGGGLALAGLSYEVELSAEDTVGKCGWCYTAVTSRVTLHLRAGGMGTALRQIAAEQEALECVWPAVVFYGDVADPVPDGKRIVKVEAMSSAAACA